MGILEILALIVVPGAIPVWLGHKIYKKLKKPKTEESTGE